VGGKNGNSPVVGFLHELGHRTDLEEKSGCLVVAVGRLLPLLLLGSLQGDDNRGARLTKNVLDRQENVSQESHVRHEDVGNLLARLNLHEDRPGIKELGVNSLGRQEAATHDVDFRRLISGR